MLLSRGMYIFITKLSVIFVLIRLVFIIILKLLHRRTSLNWVLPLLPMNFFSSFRLELLYMTHVESFRPVLTHLCGF